MFNIEQLSKAPCWNYNDEVEQFCAPLRKLFNITYFDYSRFYHDNSCIVYFSDRDYVEYFTSQSEFVSPSSYLTPGKYLWQTHIPDMFLQIANERFDLCHGLTVYREQPLYNELFNFSGAKSSVNLLNVYLNNYDLLEAFVAAFCEAFEPHITKHAHSRIILPTHDIGTRKTSNICAEDIIKYAHDIFSNTNVRLNQKVVLYNNALYCLSIRECECLQYLLKGCSHKEISQNMNISLRTTTVFCQNVYHKLNVKNHIELLSLFSNKHMLLIS